MNLFQTTSILTTLLFSSISMSTTHAEKEEPKTQLKVGDKICTVGYIMDSFCIDRGTLFDNRSVETLGPEGPIKHSVHCLIDVPSCIASPWEILNDASEDPNSSMVEGVAFGRSFRVDNNDMLVDYAKTVGVCDKGCTGDLVRGLKAAVVGEIVNLGGSNTPAMIKVMEVGDEIIGCANVGDDVVTEFDIPNMVMMGGSLNTVFLLHGSLMMIAWGFLLPAGAFFAKFFKHRPDGVWFKIHRFCQVFGLIIAIIGFILALVYSKALSDRGSGSLNYPHAVMGVTTMAIGIFQPLNAFFRPKHVEGAEMQSSDRIIWEVLHKGLGWIGLVLAAVTIGFGTTLLSTKSMQRSFQICYGALIGGMLILLLGFLMFDKNKYMKVPREEQAHKKMTNDDEDA